MWRKSQSIQNELSDGLWDVRVRSDGLWDVCVSDVCVIECVSVGLWNVCE
jgi:hypothetical protein